jgi:hypothetical protein
MPQPYESVPPERSRSLARFYRWVTQESKLLSAEKLRDAMEQSIHFACVPSRDTIYRFATNNTDSDTSEHFVVSLVYFAGFKYKVTPPYFANVPHEHHDILRYCVGRYETWTMNKVFHQNFLPKYKKNPYAMPSELFTTHRAIDELGMPAEAISRAANSIFGSAVTESVFGPINEDIVEPKTTLSHTFLIYRYSAEAGYIDKSAMTVSIDRSKGQYASFINLFYDDKRNRRITSGFATATIRKLYFLGSIDDFTGMKIMGFSSFSHTKTIIPGMLMSISSYETIVCARLLLRRVESIDESSLGQKAEHEIRQEIGEHIHHLAN